MKRTADEGKTSLLKTLKVLGKKNSGTYQDKKNGYLKRAEMVKCKKLHIGIYISSFFFYIPAAPLNLIKVFKR